MSGEESMAIIVGKRLDLLDVKMSKFTTEVFEDTVTNADGATGEEGWKESG